MPYGLRKRGATNLQSKYNEWGKVFKCFKWNKGFKANNSQKCWTENEYLNDRRLQQGIPTVSATRTQHNACQVTNSNCFL